MVKSKKQSDILQWLLILVGIVLINYVLSFLVFRLDLTSEKRYSLNESTKALVKQVDETLLIKIYLEGDLQSGLQKLQRETKQMLDELRAINGKIEYEFINPTIEDDPETTKQIYQQLRSKGLISFQFEQNTADGKTVKQIFPGAITSYKEKELPLQLLVNQFASSPETQINISIQNLEYTLANTIKKLVSTDRPNIAFLKGHGELDDRHVADMALELSQYYNVDKFNIKEFKADTVTGDVSIEYQMMRMNTMDAIIVAKPTKPFNDLDKLLLDQYIMKGGKILWLIDAVQADLDSLSQASSMLTFPIADKLNLTDMLFKYGARINTNLVQDLVAGGLNDRKSINRWVYFPLLMPQTKHPIVKDLNAIKMDFASTVDTIIAPGIKKTFLLRTSPYTLAVPTPHLVELKTLYDGPNEAAFTQKYLPMAVLLEGEFTSLFANRIVPKDNNGNAIPILKKSKPTQMLVVGDGDIIKNQLNIVNPNVPRNQPLSLGYDQFTGMQYGNKDFLMNTIDYMLDESGLISIRSRELEIRLLDLKKVKAEKFKWQIINVALPIVAVLLFGLFYTYNRKRKYTR